MYFFSILHLFQLALLMTILVYVIRLSNRKESFANCFGMQYNGLPFVENKNAPICPHAYTSPYREGGCVQYDPQEMSVEYATRPQKNGFIRFV